MIRIPFRALPSLVNHLVLASLLAAAAIMPAQAGIVRFDTDYTMPIGSGDTWSEAGYRLSFQARDPDAVGSAVGALIDANDPWPCMEMACPVNGDGGYYGAFNDSIVWIESETAGTQFRFNALDASFIGADLNLGAYPILSGLLRIQAWKADGSYVWQDLSLSGPGVDGFGFSHYDFDGIFGDTSFVKAALSGYACDATGACDLFDSNLGQFGLDNINLTEVPEPAAAVLLGLGILGLIAVARRRKPAGIA